MIRAAYAVWSLVWVLLVAVEWQGRCRYKRLLLYAVSWFAGGAVLAAASILFKQP